jgi:hypothetical protein
LVFPYVLEQRAAGGFEDLDEVTSHSELESIVCTSMAGFDQTQVNR